MALPSGDHATSVTLSAAMKTCRWLPVSASQMVAVSSRLAVTMASPSGDHATRVQRHHYVRILSVGGESAVVYDGDVAEFSQFDTSYRPRGCHR